MSPILWKRFWSLFLLSLLNISLIGFWSTSSKSEETWFEACEADDARYLVEKFGKEHWQGNWYRFGRWSFRHIANIACTQQRCAVSTNLDISFSGTDIRDDGITQPDIYSVLPDHKRDVTKRVIVKNGAALDLHKSIRDKSFSSSGNQITTIWVDYGKLADHISVRSRTQINCNLNLNYAYCTIDDNSVAFVPYDEHHECGYISDHQDPDGFYY